MACEEAVDALTDDAAADALELLACVVAVDACVVAVVALVAASVALAATLVATAENCATAAFIQVMKASTRPENVVLSPRCGAGVGTAVIVGGAITGIIYFLVVAKIYNC